MYPYKEAIFRLVGMLGIMLSCFSLSGCIVTSGAAFGAASGAMEAKGVGNDFKYYLFDVPPQVIYRIDDHRFFTLENYKDCDHGGSVYYHDTNKNIKEYINGGSDSNSILTANPMMSWKGQFVYAASDNVVAFMSRYPLMSDRDTHSGVFLTYKINGKYGEIKVAGDTDPGFRTILVVTDDNLYIKSRGSLNLSYSLPAKKINSMGTSMDQPRSAEGEKWPNNYTLSGAIRFTCDITIRPTNVSVTTEQVYAADATGIPHHE